METFYLVRFMHGDDQEHSDVMYCDTAEDAAAEARAYYEASFGPVPAEYRVQIMGPFSGEWHDVR